MTVTELASWEGGSQYDCHRASLLGGKGTNMTVTELVSWEGGDQYDCHRASLLGGREPI